MSALFGDIAHGAMTATERVEFSRARLRAAMSPPPPQASGAGSVQTEEILNAWKHHFGG